MWWSCDWMTVGVSSDLSAMMIEIVPLWLTEILEMRTIFSEIENLNEDGLAPPLSINRLDYLCRSSLCHFLWKTCFWALHLLSCWVAMFPSFLFIRWRKKRWRRWWLSSRYLGVCLAWYIKSRNEPIMIQQPSWQGSIAGGDCLVACFDWSQWFGFESPVF